MKDVIDNELKKEIYKDAVQPVSKSFGEAVQPAGEVLGKAVVSVVKTADALLISPFHFTVWGVEALKEHFIPKVEQKLKKVPEEKRAEPDPLIAGPALQAVRFATRHEELQNLFANLLATAIDKDTLQNAHPAFVHIIHQMLPDEAKILRFASNKDMLPIVNVHLLAKEDSGKNTIFRNVSTLPADVGFSYLMGATYIDNLCRLKIFDKPQTGSGFYIQTEDAYSQILDGNFTKSIEQIESQHGRKVEIEKSFVTITDFGRQFINACVVSKN